jgi:hypothetical protein
MTMDMTETITLPKAEYEAMVARLEDAEDALTVRGFRESVAAEGWETATRDCLPIALVERKLAGKHPIRIWREQRKLSLRALGEIAHIPASYISEIETYTKPGSVSAYAKIANALKLSIEDILPKIAMD